MSWKITATYDGLVDDPDANSYLARVEAADGQILEPAVRLAINNFVKGCKADGIWNAIKASCILAGARTLAGALVPLVGPAPTNFNFVSGDYNRRTGLVGNGSTKYLNSNRNNNADPLNSFHIAINGSSLDPGTVWAGTAASATRASYLTYAVADSGIYVNNRTNTNLLVSSSLVPGFAGSSRSASNLTEGRYNKQSVSFINVPTGTLTAQPHYIYCYNNGSAVQVAFSASRLNFYSIGEALDLALLDARVTALMDGLAAVLP